MQSILQRLAQSPDKAQGETLSRVIERLYNTQNLSTTALRITGASAAATWETQNIAFYLLDNVQTKAEVVTAQAVPSACTWTAAASTFNATGFLVLADGAGAITTLPANNVTGTSAVLALGKLKWPRVAAGYVVLGAVIIRNTTANVAFTAGTTNLDASNISTKFIDITGPFFPTAAI